MAGNYAFNVYNNFIVNNISTHEGGGISLNDAIEFNQKNTTLRIGASQSFDSVEPVFFTSAKDKNSTDVLLGVSQLLSAKTIFTADFTYGYFDHAPHSPL